MKQINFDENKLKNLVVLLFKIKFFVLNRLTMFVMSFFFTLTTDNLDFPLLCRSQGGIVDKKNCHQITAVKILYYGTN